MNSRFGCEAGNARCTSLRARLFEIGGKIASHARQTIPHLASTAPDVHLLLKRMKLVAARSLP
ncbi:hypothetical protein G6034_14970 [Arthrobacter sp. AETb3-4]|uniref:Transposase DDE domain-containing protein n=1 Tax=Arthrobacter wenxiniae TaxID=2713570 RepID=A0A7Y7IJB1_9MICC|nr:hypothetical protein [Arthrobacter wenxiniae]